MKIIKKHLLLILLVLFFFHLGFRIFSYLPEYIIPFDPVYWEDRYNQSQWIIADSKYPIGDDGLYAHVGWKYIHGLDPTLLNAEIPPLSKYIIGIGEITFKNQNILILIIGLLCLGVFYLLNLKIFNSKLLAFIPVFIFSFDPLFYSQLRAPYLDTIYLFFLLCALYFLLSKKYFLSSFFLGCFAATKFPAGSLFLAFSLISWIFLFDRERMKKFLLSLILWPSVFVFSYFMHFFHGGNPISFLGVQKWIVNFYVTGASSSVGILYPLLFNGTWFTWFSETEKVVEWTILWPISFVLSIISGIFITRLYFVKKEKKEIQGIGLILLWTISYFVFLTFTPIFPRYLLLLLPFMYNLSVWYLSKKY